MNQKTNIKPNPFAIARIIYKHNPLYNHNINMGTLSFLEYIWMGVLSTIIITPIKLFGWWGGADI